MELNPLKKYVNIVKKIPSVASVKTSGRYDLIFTTIPTLKHTDSDEFLLPVECRIHITKDMMYASGMREVSDDGGHPVLFLKRTPTTPWRRPCLGDYAYLLIDIGRDRDIRALVVGIIEMLQVIEPEVLDEEW